MAKSQSLAVTFVQLMAESPNWYMLTLAEIMCSYRDELAWSQVLAYTYHPCNLRTLGYSVKQTSFPVPPVPGLYNIHSIMRMLVHHFIRLCATTSGFKIRHYVRLTFLAIVQQQRSGNAASSGTYALARAHKNGRLE